ncbi:MAG: hypothetical protein K0R62_8386 [Nonomuraea muscovyensis]|jgi:hypothetical protein|nr:hypothetical protein [Nonomuraea muscovyensis]
MGLKQIALDTVQAVSDVAVAAAGTGGYTPAEMGTDLAAGAGTILGYVGVGVGGAIGVALALIGIRRGIGAFRSNAR